MATTLPAPGAGDALYLVDLSSYVFRAYHAITPLSNTKGEPTHATYGTIAMLQKLIGERKPSLLAVAMDSRTPTFRHALDPNYKATRKDAPPDLHIQMDRSRQIVEAYRIPIYQCEGMEADDVIATVVERAQTEGLSVVIVGADKDLMQLVSDRVVLWDTMRDKVYGPAEVEAKFGVPPAQLRDLLALMGDSSDNVPGVPSVGPKTAAELLRQFGSVDGIYERLPEVAKKRTRDLLAQHQEDARRSVELVTLRRDVPVRFDLEHLRYGGADFETLRSIYTELGFTRMIAQIPAPPKPQVAIERQETVCRTITDLAELEAALRGARESGRLALGLETSSPQAMRADLLGMAFSVRPSEALYVPIQHRYLGAPRQLTMKDVERVLSPVLEDESIRKIGHDLKYLSVVLARHGLPSCTRGFDVLIASYLLDAEAKHELPLLAERELGERLDAYDTVTKKSGGRGGHIGFDELDIERATQFSAKNVEAVLRLADRLGERIEQQSLTKLLDTIEMPVLRVLCDMEQCGVLVDTAELARLKTQFEAEIVNLEARAHAVAGHAFNVNSARQLEVILFDELGMKPIKRTKTARSTDADVLEQLGEEHELPRILLEHRQLSKLKGTYVDALPELVNPHTRRIHTEWGQAAAATGRIASNNPNLQNIPIRTELGRAIRRAFIAPPGTRIVSADYSQIELRVLAHLSQDPVLIDAFRSGQDVHTRTAMEVFGVAAEQVTEEMRRKAKTINFGVIYGMGEVALAKRLDIPRTEAAAFIEAYFKRYHRVSTYMQETLEQARRAESVRTLFGRQRILPNLRSSNGMLRAAAERVAQNTPIQGTAADLLKLAMIRLTEPVVPGARMVLTVHDELVFEVPEALETEAKGRIRELMQTVYPLDVPLLVDVGSGTNWGDLHYDP